MGCAKVPPTELNDTAILNNFDLNLYDKQLVKESITTFCHL